MDLSFFFFVMRCHFICLLGYFHVLSYFLDALIFVCSVIHVCIERKGQRGNFSAAADCQPVRLAGG
jgi:hypothetical protein